MWPVSLDAHPPRSNEEPRRQLLHDGVDVLPLTECFYSQLIAQDWLSDIPFPSNTPEDAEKGHFAAVAEAHVWFVTKNNPLGKGLADAEIYSLDTVPPSAIQSSWPGEREISATIPELGTDWHNIVLSQAFSQTGRESEALHYYANIYPTMTVSKNLHWTTYKIILVKNSQDPLTMHFLLAASLIDLATLKGYDPAVCHAARSHAKAGMLLLEEALAADTSSDPVAVMTACLFLYRYTGIATELDPAKMADWSRSICNFVERHGLDDFCNRRERSAVQRFAEQNDAHKNMTRETRAHLSRLLLWTFYEDVFAGIKGYGGFLARRMCDQPARARDVYQHSSAELECFWGKDYPEREIIDDIENAPIINFLYEVIALHAEVNKVALSQSRSAEDIAAVGSKIDRLEAVGDARQHYRMFD